MAEAQPLLAEKVTPPSTLIASMKRDRKGRKIPQAIAHRGYKTEHPENTMGAFRGAVEVGAHAIETDLHITKDGIVVLSHDPTLKRCFGREEKVIDCDWDYIKTLETLAEPREHMPRLKDLLEYLASPGVEDIWLLLDIKLDNDADTVMRLIAETVASVKPSKPWEQRIVLGCWAAKYLPLCTTYLPGFPITHIGFSISYAREFLKVPNVTFNMLQKIMIGPFGARFQRDAQAAGRAVYVWTVNDDDAMRWSIRRGVDGVLTDDPKRYLEICDEYVEGMGGVPVRSWPLVLWINFLALFFGALFRWRYFGVQKTQKAGKARMGAPA